MLQFYNNQDANDDILPVSVMLMLMVHYGALSAAWGN